MHYDILKAVVWVTGGFKAPLPQIRPGEKMETEA